MLANPTIGRASLGFRVEEDNDSPSLCRGSLGFWPDQGVDVEGLYLYITPDVGWANRELMFQFTRNPSLKPFAINSLQTTSLTDAYLKGPTTLVFTYEGSRYRIPVTEARQFAGSPFYYWRVGENGPIQAFRYIPHAPPVEEEPESRANKPRILN